MKDVNGRYGRLVGVGGVNPLLVPFGTCLVSPECEEDVVPRYLGYMQEHHKRRDQLEEAMTAIIGDTRNIEYTVIGYPEKNVAGLHR
jgi:hypothetical protein